MSIYEENNGWGGKTQIQPDFQSLLSWTTIAIAGIVAEARADANRRFREPLVIASQLVEEVKRYVDAVVNAEKKKQTMKPIQITFRTSGGNEGVSAISPDDVQRMPPLYRDRLSLRTALEGAEEICRNPEHWGFIEELSQGLLAAPDHTLYRGDIEKILGLR
jgi:hypothetical protein